MGRILVLGEPGNDFVKSCVPNRANSFIDKPGKGAFYATNLQERLRALSIQPFDLYGSDHRVCVQTSI